MSEKINNRIDMLFSNHFAWQFQGYYVHPSTAVEPDKKVTNSKVTLLV